MNRYILLGSQVEGGQEWCYLFDSETGVTYKSVVKVLGASLTPVTPVTPVVPLHFSTTPPAFNGLAEMKPVEVVKADPAGEMETPEQREARINHRKVPPAFMSSNVTLKPPTE